MSDLSQIFSSSLPIEVKPSKPKYALLLLVCVAATAFLLWMLTHGQAPTWIVSLCIVGTSLGVALCIYALCDKRPLVVLDKRGVTARGWKGCPVAWSDIERVWKHEQHVSTMYSSVEVDYVCIAFKHSERWRHSQGPIRKRFAAYCHSMGYGDLYFSTKGMNFEANELVAAIQSHIGGVRLSAPASLLSDAVRGDA
jgi:hypothetical protein